jgi:hypothetical protein
MSEYRRSRRVAGSFGVREDLIMLKKVLPIVILASFIAGPAFAAGDAAKKCAKITDKAKKEECLKKAKAKK